MSRIQFAAKAYTFLIFFAVHETFVLALHVSFISCEVLDFFASFLLNQSSSAEYSSLCELCLTPSDLEILISDLLQLMFV